MKSTSFVVTMLVAAAMGSCGKKPAGESAPDTSTTPRWVLSSEPAGAEGVTQARTHAKEGDEIVIVGRIGGRRQALSEQSGTFVIMDPQLPACSDNPADSCPTPWDYCCETPETILGNSATIQIVGADATPIVADPIAAGLSPLDTVVVRGTVAARPSPDVLTILAKGVYKRGG